MAKRASTTIDIHIGRRISMRRHALNLSQTELGEAIGVSAQQIKKYEQGENRVGAEHLHAMATALKVSVVFFFEAGPGSKRIPQQATFDFIAELLADKRGIELARHFVEITDMDVRNAIHGLEIWPY